MTGLEALLTGRTLGDRYRIEEVIGRGGMGAVYRATDERLGRAVAVKVITLAGGDAAMRDKLRARFRHEASAAARLPHHPNVVPVYDYGTDAALGLDYLVMELLRGEDLASRLGRSGLPPVDIALRILLGAARGVAVGHRAGLIHRDVKPGNVFLAQTGNGDETTVRVVDFGIAKLISDEEAATTQLTHDGRAPLSPAYASPEQLRGEERLTPASDVFSLGALGFQLLSGERPFTEADRNRMSIGMPVPVPSLRARNPAVPEVVDAVLRKALAFDPRERFPDAGALADAVQRAASGASAEDVLGASAAGVHEDRTIIAPAPAPDATMLAPPPPPPRTTATPVTGPAIPPPRRRRAVAEEPRSGGARTALLALFVLLVLGGGAAVAWQLFNNTGEPAQSATLPADTAGADTLAQPDTLGDETDALAAALEGRRLLQRTDYAGALALFDRAVRISPANAEYRDLRGFALLMLRRPQDAVPDLEEAIRLDPNFDLPYSHLADARLALGDTTAAITALDRYLSVSLNRAGRDQVQQRLDVLTAPKPVAAPAPRIDSTTLRPSTLPPSPPADSAATAPPAATPPTPAPSSPSP